LPEKHCRGTHKELVVAHITTNRPIQEEANRYNQTTDATYYYGKRIGMIM
jgi:hypothetical protein